MPRQEKRSKILAKITEEKAKGSVKAVILVGGEGTRLRPLTYSTVKAMVPVLNKPFIEYVFRHLSNHKIKEIILALGHKPDCITDYFGDARQLGTMLVYSVETDPMGTAGAIKNAEQYIDDTFFVMNGDIFTDINLTDMLRFHKNKGAKVTIALTPVEDPTRFGVVETDSNQRVTRFVEKPKREQVTSNMINAGVYIIETEILKRIPQGKRFMFERDVFPALLADGEPVSGYATDVYWIDAGTPEQYLQLNHDLMFGKSVQVAFTPEEIRINEKSSVHPQAKLTGPILVDRDCTIGKGVQLKGPVVIGTDCTIKDGAIIENSILWQNVTIGEQAILKDCIVASNSCIDNNACIECATLAQTKE
ncbi:MAG: NDP-sugar synthase [Chloroflexi bacterium]|nr:NDP-sugar synthase [Chloroflexota bacterium]